MKKYIIIFMVLCIIIFLVFFLRHNDNYVKMGNVYISEIVASNNGIQEDDSGEYNDYIEIYNDNNQDINLKDYQLADSETKWTFPDFIIKSHEYKIIYASSKNYCNGSTCHTNFKLSTEKEVVSLIDLTGTVVSSVSYSKLSKNMSYSLYKDEYVVTIPTPGRKNEYTRIEQKDAKMYNGLIINEYLTHNKGSHYAPNGGYYDWVELFNSSNNDLNLNGVFLTDKEDFLNKYMFPDIVVKSKEYIIVYLTGDETVDGVLSANFKLSDDEKIILSANNQIIDSVDIVLLDTNMSYGRKEGKWFYFFTPTPGKENTTSAVSKWREN